MNLRIILLLLGCLTLIFGQASVKYKSCAESETCNYLRNKPVNPDEFWLYTSNFQLVENTIRFNVRKNNQEVLNFLVTFYDNDIIRLQMEELFDPNRYYLDDVLVGDPPAEGQMWWFEDLADNLTMIWKNDHLLSFYPNPMFIEFYYKQDLFALFNNFGRLTFEHDASHPAIGFDVTFLSGHQAYGLPLHADDLFLRETGLGGDDPYRLYNLNVPNYESDSTQALSGSVPLVYIQGQRYTAGLFFHNGYETWVDYTHTHEGCNIHFMVQNGIFDAFFLLGPTPADVYKQYTILTGTPPLPPYWSLGYHHGTTSADTDEDIKAMIANFDSAEIPIDAVFLTDRDSSFAFNTSKYADPENLQLTVLSTGRKLVGMVNPYLKVDFSSHLFVEAVRDEYLVYSPTREIYTVACLFFNPAKFEGESYAGESGWWDFTNPHTWDYYKELFLYANYTGATPVLAGFWNALNEPVVLNEEERVLPEDGIHYRGFYHRDVHNIYSHLMNQQTYDALLARDDNVRPFVLSESFFAGTQRYSAIYTGENNATWDNLRSSVQMCLTASITGFSFCGANIGGYYGNPEPELLRRWYQVGAWLPFFRTQYSDGSERREPYLLAGATQDDIRGSLRTRYAHVQIWYTLFYEQERFGVPVLRPIFFQYPNQVDALTVQEGYFVGDNILVHPVVEPNIATKSVYLPMGQIWYDVDTQLLYNGYGYTTVSVSPSRIPVFYRGGGVIARRDVSVRGTADTTPTSSYTVYIFLDNTAEAHGTIYIDDGRTFNYRNNVYYYLSLDYTGGTIQFNQIDSDASYPVAAFIVDQYLLYRPPSTMTKGAGPVSVEPQVITHTADGRAVKDVVLDLSKETTVELNII